MSSRRFLKHPVIKSFSSLLLSPLKHHYHLNDKSLLWLKHPGLGLAFFYDYRQCAKPADYKRLLGNLIKAIDIDCRPLKEFLAPAKKGTIIVALRHDIDNDICAALALARIEHSLGLKGSYYVLHTMPYYGFFRNERFHHSQKCLDILLEIQSLGHEVGLHNDCLNPLLARGIPVSETLLRELGYLREKGLNIKGTVSHGSYHTYLASNYEIFQGLSINGRNYFTDATQRTHPLNMIPMSDFGLTYEGNHILRSFMVSKQFYDEAHLGKFTCPASESDWMERNYDAQYGIFGKDYWLGTDERSGQVYTLNEQQAFAKVTRHQPGSRIVLDSHPEYYGQTLIRSWLRSMGKYILN